MASIHGYSFTRRIWVWGPALLGLALTACSSNRTPFQGATAAGDEVAVHAAVVRFVARNYQPVARAGPPRAWCLAVGRRAGLAASAFYRTSDEPWTPSSRLLSRIRGVEPPVIPVSECGQDDGLQERILETGEPAILLVISQPTWTTQDNAWVSVGMRENPSQVDQARCRLVRGAEGWRVRDCV